MKLFRSFGTVALHTVGSRIMGFIRTIILANIIGPGSVADALSMASKFPSVLRRIFAEGAFNAVFVPMYSKELSEHGKKAARELAQDVFNFLVLILLIVVALAEIYMESILGVLISGFLETPERFALTVFYTRITFPFILFISLCAFYGGILNSHNRFAAVASSPTIGNLAIILVFFSLYTFMEDHGLIMAISILVCGIVQWVWVWIPARRLKTVFHLRMPRYTPAVKKFFRKILPALAGGGVVQINILVGAWIASGLPKKFVSYLEFAERLSQLPLSVIGTAISTAMLPTLARQFKKDTITQALETQNNALQLVLFLTLPAAIGLFCLSDIIVTVLFQRGMFDATASMETAAALQVMALGLPAYILVKVFTTTFFANENTRLPLFTGAISIVIDIWLSLLLIGTYKHVGIAFATAIASWSNTVMLLSVLVMRKHFLFSKEIRLFMLRIAGVSIIFGLFLELLKLVITGWDCAGTVVQILTLGSFLILGVGFYAFLCHKSGTYNVVDFYRQFLRQTK